MKPNHSTEARNYPTRVAALSFASLSVASLFCLAGALQAEQTVKRTLTADSEVRVSIECIAGSIRVIGWDRDEVSINGTAGDDAEVEISGGGSNIDIEVRMPSRRRGNRMKVSADLEVQVPRRASVDVEGLSVSTTISDFSGKVDVETMSGNIDISGDASEASIESVSGTIRVSGADTEVDAETVSGSIILDGVAGKVDASAVSGSVKVRAGQVERADLETVTGTISFEGSLASNARLSASTHSGSINLVLPASTSATFEVETFSGNIDNELSSAAAEKVDRYTPGRRLEFTLGSGSARVHVEAFSGNVTLRP